MCGLAGFLHFGGETRPRRERLAVLARMGRQLRQRGPDDERVYDDGTLSLVFRRLSIVDLERGGQPFWNETGTILAAVNGEIYNHIDLREKMTGRHSFISRSDCEVVPHLYEEVGLDLLEQLNGMFAIAIWDCDRQVLHLARDRLGIKPIYYAHLQNGLLFGSELKALLAHPDCPDEFDWRDLDLGYLDGEMYTALNFTRVPSFVKGVELLPGGTVLTASSAAGVQRRRYWSIDAAIEEARDAAPAAPRDRAEVCADLIEDSVRKRMMSDVPIGLFLSGGLDSSIIAAVASRTNQDLHCFTVVARPTIAAGDVERARALTDELGLPWHPVVYDDRAFVDQLNFGLKEFEYFIWMLDAPRFAPEQIFKHELHRYAKTVTPEIKVMLLGQGVDEFAGGYSRPMGGPERDWSDFAEADLRQAHRRHGQNARGVDPIIAPFLSDRSIMAFDGAPYHREMRHRIWSLQSHNLWNEDRVSSSQGVEARVPFLDHRIVDYMAAIPPAQHAEVFLDKSLIRQASERWLSGKFTTAPKVPFWEVGDTSAVHDLMHSCALRAYPEFRAAYCGHANALFCGDALDRLHVAAKAGPDRRRATKLLMIAMAVAVFDRLCKEIRSGKNCTPLTPPSPLRAADDRTDIAL